MFSADRALMKRRPVAREVRQVELERVEMPRVAAAQGLQPGAGPHPGDPGEGLVVDRPDALPHRQRAFEPGELVQPEGGLHVGHVVLVAGLERLVGHEPARGIALPRVLVEAVQPERAQPLDDGRVVGREHPALAGGEVLGGVEAEGREAADRADLAAAVPGLRRVRGVLDHREPVARGERADRVHLAGPARHVHRHQGPGAGRDRALRPGPDRCSGCRGPRPRRPGPRPRG